MTITRNDIKNLSNDTRQALLHLLWNIEDELLYENKSVTEMIDYIQNNERSN